MITHAKYDAKFPLPPRPSSSITQQIHSYINQQEWFPEFEKRHRKRNGGFDLRKDKCKSRYKDQFFNGPVSTTQLMRAFRIQRQSVLLKMREYTALGFVIFNRNISKWEWIEDDES